MGGIEEDILCSRLFWLFVFSLACELCILSSSFQYFVFVLCIFGDLMQYKVRSSFLALSICFALCSLYLCGCVFPYNEEGFFYDHVEDLVCAIGLEFFSLTYIYHLKMWSFHLVIVIQFLHTPFPVLLTFIFFARVV